MGDRSAIAIVGIACRVAGASTTAGLWGLLRTGVDAVGEMPADRRKLVADAVIVDPSGAEAMSHDELLLTNRGGWLGHIEMFDSGFFGISPREAAAMDPQQRLMLELCWEAFEDAGVPPASLAGKRTAVFVGAIAGDYTDLMQSRGGEAVTRHALTGLHRSMIANRVSYALGLRGPSMTVDTGQSSSLVAVHLACESLRRGESGVALACGVHMNISPRSALTALRFGGLSPDGRCFTFDERANGYVRGEGGGVVALKPLSDALEAGDHIYGVIHASAVNNDGGGEGLVAPSRQAQEEVLRLAYRRSAVKHSDVGYVELHGTGTKLGDRIEAGALGSVLGAKRPAHSPLAVGSIKTNIGHLEGAAGILGLIKAALCVKHREIPPSLNFRSPPADVPLEDMGLCVQQTLDTWRQERGPLCAGVSSFGLGGTNCHVVLGEPPAAQADGLTKAREGLVEKGHVGPANPLGGVAPVWILSGREDSALRTRAESLAEHIGGEGDLSVEDVAHTLAFGREAFDRRAVVLGGVREDLLLGLGGIAKGVPTANVLEGTVVANADRGVVFVFPGQGSQWEGMAVDLLRSSPVFAERIRECSEALAQHTDWSLEDVLSGAPEAPSLERIDVVQPALFAVMVALAELWRVCGVRPAAVIGHSQGEIAAAHIAGGLSLEDAALIVATRSHALVELGGLGGMLSIALSEEEVAARLQRLNDERIVIAGTNGPASVVVSGELDALERMQRQCERENVRARRIAVDFSGHSPQVEKLRARLLDSWAQVKPAAGGVPFYSTVTGGQLDTAALGAEYWYRNVREPVRFEQCARALLQTGWRAFVEVSPHPVAVAGLEETIEHWCEEEHADGDPTETAVVGTLSRDEGGPDAFMRSLAEAWTRGAAVDWTNSQAANGRTTRLPTYPFQRRRHWLDQLAARDEITSYEHSATAVDTATPGRVGAGEASGAGVAPPEIDAGKDVRPAIGEARSPQLAGQAGFGQTQIGRSLANAPAAAHRDIVLDAVCAQVAVVTGEASPEEIDPSRAFKDLGFDSRAAVELRNRLRTATGLRLPASLLFDHPTPGALASYLLDELSGASEAVPVVSSFKNNDDPLAIVGMSCRYPGGVFSPRDLWGLVSGGGDAISPFPRDRGWDLRQLTDAEAVRGDRQHVLEGGFLNDACDFDADFFGISPREARAMDPQQRLLLEAAWEALEDSGFDPRALRGSQTGVFAGISSQDYYDFARGMPRGLEGYGMTGGATSVVSGRVAYSFGFEGPAVTIDTACSSSLVAIHLACQSLRAGECSLALAGGVTILSSPSVFVEFIHQDGLAVDGRCKAFSDHADGTAFSEGVGVVVLERLSDAQRNGHPVLALVRGSAINQDGASNGLTAPNGPSQQRVIRQALVNAGLSADQVDAVEAHGTGTRLGDPIEAQALLATYGQSRPQGRPLWLGSVKSNIGHTQAAAGIAGLIKMVMALRNGVLPRTLYAEQPSSRVDWSEGAMSLLVQEQSWPPAGAPRRAGVSSFGISGTNAHLIVEEAPASAEETEVRTDGPFGREIDAWVLSARDSEALGGQAARLDKYLSAETGLSAGEVGRALARRTAFEHRAVLLGGGDQDPRSVLRLVGQANNTTDLLEGSVGGAGRIVFVFPGQGGQWRGMAEGLLECSPVFAEQIRLCEQALEPLVDWGLEDVLRGAPQAPDSDRVDVLQPVLFAVMVALARLWQACGVQPEAVVGHSQGEIAAAHIAGALSLEDAARVIAVRSKALTKLSGLGGMVSVALGLDELEAMSGSLQQRVSVAAINGPAATVVSGDPAALDELLASCRERGVRARHIPVDYAAHSSQVEQIRDELIAGCEPVVPRSSTVPFYSTTTGGLLDTATLDADYWYSNLRETVRFEQAVRALVDDHYRTFIEVGPHPVLAIGMQETVDSALQVSYEQRLEPNAERASRAVVLDTLRRKEGGAGRFVRSLAQAWVQGVEVDWARVLGGPASTPPSLPTYAFQRQRYWLANTMNATSGLDAAGQTSSNHPLLGAIIAFADNDGWLFTGRLSLDTHPWLEDHTVQATTILPATALLELALHAATHTQHHHLNELTLEAPLILPDHQPVQLQLAISPPNEHGEHTLTIHSRPIGTDDDSEWTRHASGSLTNSGQSGQIPDVHELCGEWPPSGAQPLSLDGLYEQLAERGFEYGPSFQGLQALWQQGDDVFAEVALAEEQLEQANTFAIHPALLDSALQASLLALPEHTSDSGDNGRGVGTSLPFAFTGVALYRSGASRLRVSLKVREREKVSITVADETGELVATIDSLAFREAPAGSLRPTGDSHNDSMFALDWIRHPSLAAAGGEAGEGLVVLGESSLGTAMSERGAATYSDLESLVEALVHNGAAGETVLVDCPTPGGSEGPLDGLASALSLAQAWLAQERLASMRLVFVTHRAVGVHPAERVQGLSRSPLWGLIRSAQSENPGRFALVDTDESECSIGALAAAVRSGEPQLAIRDGETFLPRLARGAANRGLLAPEDEGIWRLEAADDGTLDGLSLIACADGQRPLVAGEVRVAVRAGGLNFRDVLVALGMRPEERSIGIEGAGVVLEVADDIEDLDVGDRVFGLLAGFSSVAVADRRLLARLPAGWSFAQGAGVPVVFQTAYLGLVDLAGLKAGERILIHAGAGGVGMAAAQIAAHIGAEVFATASPSKWETLRALGLDDAHIASSRTLEFKQQFLEQTDGDGMDVILDSLSGEFVDASLELLPRGGRFLEMGKSDIRDPGEVAERHPGVIYQAFDLMRLDPHRSSEMFTELLTLFATGVLTPLPITTWDIRHAADAMRFMSQARHTGKIVLTHPGRLDAHGTVLITGGTGVLGGAVARHLASVHGVRHLLLTSRSGPHAPSANALQRELEELGVRVRIVACDVSNREALSELLETIDAEHPLSGVIHTAGALDDGVIGALDRDRLARVWEAKADGAAHLDELTRTADLQCLVLFSSVAGTLGTPGQANYAAANAYLDALAHDRRARGLPATSIAWGLWQETSALTAALTDSDRSRLQRAGLVALDTEDGLELLDATLASGVSFALATALDGGTLRAQARNGLLPAIMSGLVTVRAIRTAGPRAGAFAQRLSEAAPADRAGILLDLVRSHVAALLEHTRPEAIDPDRAFKDLGFDSLAAVDLRNRLAQSTGLRLLTTLTFEHPTANQVAEHLNAELMGARPRALAVSKALSLPSEPIAIVGMSCRFPGSVATPQQLWQLLRGGGDGIGELPGDRGWNLDALYDPDPEQPRTSYSRAGGFIADAGDFDAEFFGISPREALAMDPQQRMLLEGAWEAIEHGGIDPTTLKGTRTGVYAGVIASGYRTGARVPDRLEGFLLTGAAASVASGRVSYALGLEGPAVSLDTACSSSLVALHLASQALRAGECSMALAGGVAVMATTEALLEFSRQRGLAVDGRCKPFADAADGIGFSDGMGMLLLERLSDAERHGHRVLALIRGSATNQDGASNGLTAPNGRSQQRVIEEALANAQLTPADVDAVEAHGTGTTLGDPIEAQALLATYGQDRPDGRPLWLGSLKSNIGHTQAAAGVAGVIKMVLALGHGTLPRTLHVDRPSTHVDWEAGAVELLTEPQAWAANGRPRRAAVSSFGISGTNAHLILEEPPAIEAAVTDKSAPAAGNALLPQAPLLLSARSEEALRAQAGRLRSHLESNPELALGDVAFSACQRTVFGHRAAVVAGGREDALAGLAALRDGDGGAAGVLEGVSGAGGGAVFVFPGQGSQWQGMAAGLLDHSPLFASEIAMCEDALAPHVEWSLGGVLRENAGAPELDRVDVLQPALFAVMVSLAACWKAAGLEPAAVVGHSQGEIAAAYIAGALSLQDAARVSARRAQALTRLAGNGGMVSLALSETAATALLERFHGQIALAAVNGATSVVVSGRPDALKQLLSDCESDGIRARQIPVDYAAHSPQVEEIRDELLAGCEPITPRASSIPFYSTVTAARIDTALLDGNYWYRNLRETVRFEHATRALLNDGHRVFIETSPHPVLTVAVTQTIEDTDHADEETLVTGTLRRDHPDTTSLTTALATAWTHGIPINWANHHPPTAQQVDLPTYPFQRQHYWLDSDGEGDIGAVGQLPAEHPLLGAEVALADEAGRLFTGRLSLQSHPWLAGHVVRGNTLLPGTAFLELALHAARRAQCDRLVELTLESPLVLDEQMATQLQVSVGKQDEDGLRPLHIYARAESAASERFGASEEWTLHASGSVDGSMPPDLDEGQAGPASELSGVWPPPGATPAAIDGLYEALADRGLEYGPAFQGLRAIWRRGEELFAEVSLPEDQHGQADMFGLHPALLDAALHAAMVDPLAMPDKDAGEGTLLPFCWREVRLHGRGPRTLRVLISRDGAGEVSVIASDEHGAPVASVGSLALRPIAVELLGQAQQRASKSLFALHWIPVQAASGPGRAQWVELGRCEGSLAESLADVGVSVECHVDLVSLGNALADGMTVPEVVLWEPRSRSSDEVLAEDVLEERRRSAGAGTDVAVAGAPHQLALGPTHAERCRCTERGQPVWAGRQCDLGSSALCAVRAPRTGVADRHRW